ncbi:hypothetical protein TruAng_002123 [Truncatella angustata]|nr:hypothetical protein TruAng_002123 [Truncatella angustata]
MWHTFVLSALGCAGLVAAHGWIDNITISGNLYTGFNPTAAPWVPDQGTIGWPSWNTDTGPVYSSDVSSPDIICQKNATNAKISASVSAGSDIVLRWTTWPDSHHGPIMTYLADCGGDCAKIDKTELKWFKIAEQGEITAGSGNGTPGYWASDEIMKSNAAWKVQIPASLKAGSYVLRNEILALHSAYEIGAAQFYPQCINLQITGSGTSSPDGVVGQELYRPTEPGVHYNIYNDEAKPTYIMPGPPLYTGT